MNTPTVSIIVPVYNDERYLSEALRSIADQSFRDFEVIVCDDGSTDRSPETAEEFSGRDRRFRVVRNPSNVGMTRNWNRALKHATGQYVLKLDSDDAFRPQALEYLLGAMEGDKRPVVAYCRTLDCDADLLPMASYPGERALVRARIDPLAERCEKGHAWYRLSFDDVQLWHSNAQIHRRDVLLAMGGWDESWGCASDTDLILRILERNEPVCHVPYAGVLYRHRPGSVSAQYRSNAWLRWESCLIHLASMDRYYRAGGRVTAPLKKAWWRYWLNWKDLQSRGNAELGSMRADARERLLVQAANAPAMPASIRMQGGLRQFAWDLLKKRTSTSNP